MRTSSLTDAVKLTAGISLTGAVKDVAGRRDWFVDEVLDAQDECHARGRHLAMRLSQDAPGSPHSPFLHLAFLNATLDIDCPRCGNADRLPPRTARVALVIGNSAYQLHAQAREPQERCRRHGRRAEEARLSGDRRASISTRLRSTPWCAISRQLSRHGGGAFFLCRSWNAGRRAITISFPSTPS